MKKLRNASLDITYDCNFRCLHCYNSSGEHYNKRVELSDEELLRVGKEIAALEPDTLCLCGGETLLRKEMIYEICKSVKKIKKNKVNVTTVSNGYLMTKDIVNSLEQSGLDLIQISLDGATKESHDWLRNKKGSFERAIAALELLKKSRIPYAVAFTPTKKNVGEIQDAIELAYTLGVQSFRVQPMMKLGRAETNLENYFLNYKEYLKLRHELSSMQEKYINDSNFHIEWGDPIDHMHYGTQTNSGLHQLTINAYGDILISPYLPIAFGNVRKASIETYWDNGLNEAWHNPVIKKIISKVQSADSMDVSLWGFPKIFIEQNIMLDILSDDYKEKTEKTLEIFDEK